MGFFDIFKKSGGVESQPPASDVQPNLQTWEKGYKILNRHEILDIKKGGMGVVYIVHDHEWDRKFALKTFQDRFLRSESIIQRFMAEAETWINLERHTNIVFANTVEKIEGKPVLFLEFIDSGDLGRFVGRISIPDSLDFAIQCCTGMEYAYRKLGVIHRDIKPGNVMVQKDPRFRSGYCFKVTDFGLVKAIGGEYESTVQNVSTGIGTVNFMPPEQFSEKTQTQFLYAGKVTTRSDIYSLGVTLYALLTGRLPFMDVNQIFTSNPAHPKSLNPAIPDAMDRLILRCLEKNPEKRYPNFTVLKEEFIKITRGLVKEPYIVIGKQEDLTNIDWLNRGVALGNLGKYQTVLVCIDNSLAMDETEHRAWNDRGNTLIYLNQIPEAIRCFDKALDLYPKYTNALCRKGIAFARAGNYPEALRWYDQALEIDPDYAEALTQKGVSLGCLGRHEESMACFEKALKIYPRDPTALSHKGSFLGRSGKTHEALDHFNRALAINPREFMAWFGKGLALADLGKNREAIQCLEKFIELFPSMNASMIRQAQQIIGDLKKRNPGNTVTSTMERNPNTLERSKIQPDFTNKSLESVYHQGVTFASQGQFREALECYDNVLRIDSGNVLTWMMKGLACACLSRFPEVIECCDKALTINPHCPEAWNNKGTALAHLGRFPDSMACYTKALEINPRCTEAWYNRMLVWKNTPATLDLKAIQWSKMQQENKYLNGM